MKRVDIPKPDGGTRMLGIPTVQDRLIQQAIAQVLVEHFDPDSRNSATASDRDAVHIRPSSKRNAT